VGITTTVSSREFNQDTSGVKKAAANGPVIITDRGRPAHVLLTFAEYERMKGPQKSLAELLAMPGGEDIEFEIPSRRELVKEEDFFSHTKNVGLLSSHADVPDALFQPWYGTKYDGSGIYGKRVLILGESHYHNCEEPGCRGLEDDSKRLKRHRNLTRDVVYFWKNNPHRSPLSYQIPALFGLGKAEFWEGCAFYNYLQSFAGIAARQRPNEDQWDERLSAPAFQHVLDEFKPERILVLGRKLWTSLPSNKEFLVDSPSPEPKLLVPNPSKHFSKVDRTCYWYHFKQGGRALAMPIMHPSAPGFARDDWMESMRAWMAFDS
jgi:prevent-host-death family protein